VTVIDLTGDRTGEPAPATRRLLLPDLAALAQRAEIDPDLRRALTVVDQPEVHCTLDVCVRHDASGGSAGGWARVRSRQGLRDGLVAAVSSKASGVEVAWWPASRWQAELARVVTIPEPWCRPAGAIEDELPARDDGGLEVPFDALLAVGQAADDGRLDLLEEILRRAPGASREGTEPLEVPVARARLIALHRATLGRLVTTVASGMPGPGLGWASWLLMPGGWWALTPFVRDAEPMVRLVPVTPLDLGVAVAALVTTVRPREQALG